MSNLSSDDEAPLTPEQAKIVAKVRWLMVLSGVATFVGISVVLGVVGYRVFRSDGSAVQTTAVLPKGARIVSTTVAGDVVVVTLDIGGSTEIRSFDARTLKPAGRLTFASEP